MQNSLNLNQLKLVFYDLIQFYLKIQTRGKKHCFLINIYLHIFTLCCKINIKFYFSFGFDRVKVF